MINNTDLLYTAVQPDLTSPTYISLLREVPRTESWVRFIFLIGGLLLLACSCVVLVAGLKHGRTTTAGWVFLVIIGVSGSVALWGYSIFRRDIQPYSMPESVLHRYIIRQARISAFSSWTSFGSRWNRYERLYWNLDGSPTMRGKSPFIRAILSVWLEPGDPVYIGFDPANEYPPIFLGVARPIPYTWLREPNPDLRQVYSVLEEHFKTSRRWKGRRLLKFWGGR
jgi:hypothetical protein